MEYQDRSQLPETLKQTLPPEAQTIYVDAYNSALRSDTPTPGGELSSESAAHAVAWQAVEQEYVQNDGDGKWYRKGEEPSEEEQESGLIDKIKNIF